MYNYRKRIIGKKMSKKHNTKKSRRVILGGSYIHYKLIDWFEPYENELNIDSLCENPNAVDFIVQNITDYLDLINWEELSENPNAIPILEKNLDKVDWSRLSQNSNPKAIPLLEKKMD